MIIPSTKIQITKKSQSPKFKIPNRYSEREISTKWTICLGHWNLKFGYYLLFDHWDLGFRGISVKVNRHYLWQLELTLTDP